jgi:translation initiation factor IF-2
MSEDTNVEVTAPEMEAEQATEQQGPDLTVQDLQALKSIIDVASQRGAFKPNEMMTVGQTYGKLETFLAAVAQQQPAEGA